MNGSIRKEKNYIENEEKNNMVEEYMSDEEEKEYMAE